MSPGFDSRTLSHMWVEFVIVSYSPGTPVFPSPFPFPNSSLPSVPSGAGAPDTFDTQINHIYDIIACTDTVNVDIRMRTRSVLFLMLSCSC